MCRVRTEGGSVALNVFYAWLQLCEAMAVFVVKGNHAKVIMKFIS